MTIDVNIPAPVEPRPGAPALEKGLDVLELLATEPGGVAQKEIAARLGRSVGEIFRMLGVLERRGYIARDTRTGAYVLTLQLFRLAAQHPPTQRLQHAALPALEDLARNTGFSCHLSVISGDRFLILAQAEPDRPMGWHVRLGATFPLSLQYSSARVLAAFQREPRREELACILARHAGRTVQEVRGRLERILAVGYEAVPSDVTAGLRDVSCPVLDHSGAAAAAVTLPFLPQADQSADIAATAGLVQEAAARISFMLGGVAPC